MWASVGIVLRQLKIMRTIWKVIWKATLQCFSSGFSCSKVEIVKMRCHDCQPLRSGAGHSAEPSLCSPKSSDLAGCTADTNIAPSSLLSNSTLRTEAEECAEQAPHLWQHACKELVEFGSTLHVIVPRSIRITFSLGELKNSLEGVHCQSWSKEDSSSVSNPYL